MVNLDNAAGVSRAKEDADGNVAHMLKPGLAELGR